GPEAPDELVVLRARVGEYTEPAVVRDGDHVGGEEACAPCDRQRLGLERGEKVEAVQRGQPVHRQRRSLLERGASRDGDHGRGGYDQERPPGPALPSSAGA